MCMYTHYTMNDETANAVSFCLTGFFSPVTLEKKITGSCYDRLDVLSTVSKH